MHARLCPALLAVILLHSSASAQAVKDREGAVRGDRAALAQNERWKYNEVDLGFAEARATGKPLLVVLRCVPCLACSGIDAQVLLQNSDLAPLLERFVCVRVINANALDLARFQFDYDLSFSTLFFHGDGTLYGRYGSWTHQKNAQDKATAGFKRALEGALALHRGYPANQSQLAGKQGSPLPFKHSIDIPTLEGKYRLELDWNGKVVPSCVHCHQIGDALRLWYRNKNEPIPSDLLYPWPPSETLGLTLAQDQVARVEAVTPGSAAARAGLQPGDDLLAVAGQPPISAADVTWALHRAPDHGTLALSVRRDGRPLDLRLVLAEGWRARADISRRVGTWGLRGMATGGLQMEDLKDNARAERGLAAGQMALLVKHVGEYGKHAAAKKAGFQKDDLIVELDGQSDRVGEGEVIGQLLHKHRPGDTVEAVVLRDGARVTLGLPIQ